jgi:hypothetical protein
MGKGTFPQLLYETLSRAHLIPASPSSYPDFEPNRDSLNREILQLPNIFALSRTRWRSAIRTVTQSGAGRCHNKAVLTL